MTEKQTPDLETSYPHPPMVELTEKLPPESAALFGMLTDEFETLLETAERGLDEMSDDAFLQTVRRLSTHLENDGVPRAERKAWIMAAYKAAVYRRITANSDELEYQLDLIFDI